MYLLKTAKCVKKNYQKSMDPFKNWSLHNTFIHLLSRTRKYQHIWCFSQSPVIFFVTSPLLGNLLIILGKSEGAEGIYNTICVINNEYMCIEFPILSLCMVTTYHDENKVSFIFTFRVPDFDFERWGQ